MRNTETDRREAMKLRRESWGGFVIAAIFLILAVTSFFGAGWLRWVLVCMSATLSLYHLVTGIQMRRRARCIDGMQWSGVQPVDPIPDPPPPKQKPKDR